jgi:hypothetical protein
LFDAEDIEVAQSLVLSVMVKGELLRLDWAGRDRRGEQEDCECEGAYVEREQDWPPVFRLTYRLTAQRDHLRSASK